MIELYRYEAQDNSKTVSLELRVFHVVRETPCGYWYISEHMRGYDVVLPEWFKKEQRWVSKTARVRRCYPTKQEAMKSFTIRAKRRVMHLERQLVIARLADELTLTNEWEDKPDEYHWEYES